jgi:hypothetical protein
MSFAFKYVIFLNTYMEVLCLYIFLRPLIIWYPLEDLLNANKDDDDDDDEALSCSFVSLYISPALAWLHHIYDKFQN